MCIRDSIRTVDSGPAVLRSDLRLPGFRGRTPGKAHKATTALFPTREASTYAGTPPAFSGIQAGRSPALVLCQRPPLGTQGSPKPEKAFDMPGDALELWPGRF